MRKKMTSLSPAAVLVIEALGVTVAYLGVIGSLLYGVAGAAGYLG